MDDLGGQLRAAAEEHEPDRARMLARVESGMERSARTGRRPPRGVTAGWPRVAMATGAAALLLVGGYAVATSLHHGEQDHRVPAGPASPRPSAASPPAAPHPEDGPLRSEGALDPGSNRYWTQSEVTLDVRKPLTALTVELRIVRTGGVLSTGNWRTRPAEDFSVSVSRQRDALVYRWILKDGRTVPAGRHVFAGQYNHAEGGRSAEYDTYTARGRAGGQNLTVRGDFAPGRADHGPAR
ncbi:hypothetical protein [Streptomyces sp. NPDC017993]|uniref:hypothetical protein n=1 Tax=Streptomyces sp. NPDC017993 TaxID=3365027 RepID=UPI003796D255